MCSDNQNFVSLHIPKTAGTTLASFWLHNFGHNVCFDYTSQYKLFDGELFSIRRSIYRSVLNFKHVKLRGKRHEIRSTDRCLHGHFSISQIPKQFQDAKVITWIREPTARLVSHYRHWKRKPDRAHPLYPRIVGANIPFEEFVALPELRNLQSTYLANTEVRDLFFVGVTEKFDMLLPQLASELNLDLPAQLHRRNAALTDDNAVNVDDSVKKEIHRLHGRDYEIYNDALETLSANYDL